MLLLTLGCALWSRLAYITYLAHGNMPIDELEEVTIIIGWLLAAVQGGRDWVHISVALEPLGVEYVLLFYTYTLFCTYGLHSVFLAVFVHAVNTAAHRQDLDHMRKMMTSSPTMARAREALLNFGNRDGFISTDEVLLGLDDKRFV